MDKQERQLEDFFNGLPFDDIPDPQHRDALERQLIEKLSAPPQRQRASARIWRLVMNNRIAQLAAAAVIAVALLVPLSNAASDLVRGLIGGSYAQDSATDDFKLDRDIWITLEIGTKEQPRLIKATNVRFFTENGQLRGSLRYNAMPWPQHAWRATIELLDAQGDALAHSEYVRSSNDVPLLREEQRPSFPCAIHFVAGSAQNVSKINRFRISLEAVSPTQPTTPDDWATSNVLSVAHGHITDDNGNPIPGATIQIRQERRPAQTGIEAEACAAAGVVGIAAPDVYTSQDGFYSYDQIYWPYTVGAIVYESTPSGQGRRHQYQGWKTTQEGSQETDFAFGQFPEGNATLSGVVTDPNGAATKVFTVDARLRIGWDDESAECRYTYGHRETFATSDGKFTIRDLAAGTYLVLILPENSHDAAVLGTSRTYTCQLYPGQETIVGRQSDTEKTWYGRVLFEDGSPAVSESPDYTFQVVAWGEGTTGEVVATISNDGYFTVSLSETDMAQLKSGQTRMRVALRGVADFNLIELGDVFPVELLSPLAQEAGVIRMNRPRFYFGRLLYENGEPARPPAAPWHNAELRLWLQHMHDNATAGDFIGGLPRLDEEGYFAAYLTDEQFTRIQDGQETIQVYHPSYRWEWESHVVAQFPDQMLSTERDEAESYVLPISEATDSLASLKQYLDSAFIMKALGETLNQYAAEHGQNYPPTLQYVTLQSETLLEQVAYFPPSVTADPAETVLVYDRALLETTGTTHVIFADGHLEFCRPRRLEVLGVVPSEVDVRP